jgi:hypothetical protein
MDLCMVNTIHTPFPLNGDFHTKEIIGLVHINLCSPMVTSHGRKNIF